MVEIIQRALRLNVDFFQCFLTLKTAGRVVPLNSSDIKEFITLRQQYFKELFLHVSYWVNPSTIEYNPHKLLKRELALAKKLEFTHVIFHPGSAKGALDIQQGIDCLAQMLNKLIKKEPSFTFVLENVAQKFPSIGGCLDHFHVLLEKLENPDNIRFCIDTAHAFSHGYDITNVDMFVSLLDQKIGLDRICLIHLNDNYGDMGSHIDRHAVIGDGKIGVNSLKNIITHPKLQHISVLSEPPIMGEDDLKNEFEKIVSWHK